MATSSYDSSWRLGCTTFAIPVGASNNAVYFGNEAGVVTTRIMWVSGGTLQIIGADEGATYAGATLASLSYFQAGTSVLNLDGPANFYLAAFGTTVVCSVMRQYSQGISLGIKG